MDEQKKKAPKAAGTGGRRLGGDSIIMLQRVAAHGTPEQFPHALNGHYEIGQTIPQPAGAETGFVEMGLAEKVGGK